MPINDLEHLHRLIHKLKPGELQGLEQFLSAFHQMYGSYEPKTKLLLEALKDQPMAKPLTIKAAVHPKASVNTFRMLVGRLREKIYEVLTLDMNLERVDAYSAHYVVKAKNRKRLTQAEILHARGLIEEALDLYARIIRSAKRYETYDSLIESLRCKREIMLVRGTTVAFEQLDEEIKHFENCARVSREALASFYRLARQDAFEPGATLSLSYEDTILKLKRDLDDFPSDTGNYWLFLIQLNYLERTGQYLAAFQLTETLVEFIRKHRAVTMKRRLGSAWLHAAHYALHVSMYPVCMARAVKANTMFEAGSFNALLALDYQAYGYFYNNQFGEAESCLKELLKNTNHRTHSHQYAKRKYTLACVLFAAGKHRHAHYALRDCTELYKDKAGWNTAVRMLQIMNQMDWGGWKKQPDLLIRNLELHLQNHPASGSLQAYYKAVFSLLKQLDAQGYDYRKFHRNFTAEINEVEIQFEGFNDKTGPVLISFSEWIKRKAMKKPYQHKRGKAIQDLFVS